MTADGQRAHGKHEREDAKEADTVLPRRQGFEVSQRGAQVPFGFVGQHVQHLHRFGSVFRQKEIVPRNVDGGAKSFGDKNPAAFVVFAQAANHIDRLQSQPEFARQRHQRIFVQANVIGVPREQVRKQIPHASGHFVHVIVHIRFVADHRAARHPAGHALRAIAHVAHDGRLHFGRQGAQAGQHFLGMLGHHGVRVGAVGAAELLGQLPHVRLSGQHVIPQIQQRHFFVARHLRVVLKIIGNAEQKIGHHHRIAQHARQAFDAEGKRAAGSAEHVA